MKNVKLALDAFEEYLMRQSMTKINLKGECEIKFTYRETSQYEIKGLFFVEEQGDWLHIEIHINRKNEEKESVTFKFPNEPASAFLAMYIAKHQFEYWRIN